VTPLSFSDGGYCRHVDALRALHTQGRLPLPSVPHGPALGADEPLPF